MKDKIILCSINSRYIHSSLAVHYLSAAINEQCFIAEWTINRQQDELIEMLEQKQPRILGFSCYIWNIDYIMSLLPQIKQRVKDIKIILGGPEVSFRAEELIQNSYVDYIVSGEGEKPFSKLVERLTNGEETDGIAGVYTKTYSSCPFSDEDMPPNPYNEQYFDMLQGRISYIETVRGCPFSCSFCLSGRKEQVKYLPMNNVRQTYCS